MQQRKIKTPAHLDDAAFMRKLYLDVVGLPPHPQELAAFVSDDSPGKRDRLIERTLSDDQRFAEHWMTFWSDLLRNAYAGTGYIDGGRRQITGWLYRSLLENKRYDQFVRELIAPTAESEGFIRGIKWRGNVNASQSREVQFAQNISQVLLGINMKCASCHDSFIDRWTLKEAYIKAIGKGLSQPLDQFEVSLAPAEPARLLNVEGAPREPSRWSMMALTPAPGYVAALVVRGHNWRSAFWRFPLSLSEFNKPPISLERD